MVRIRITPQQVRTVGGDFHRASQESADMVNKLKTAVDGLGQEWEGMTRERFYAEFAQWQTSMRQFVDLLEGVGKQLDVIADRFETLDRGQ